MRIPLPKMMRHWREREFEKHLTPTVQRTGLKLWGWLAQRPKLYHLAMRLGRLGLSVMSRGRGRIGWLPLASGWTKGRDFPAPQGGTFHDQWKARKNG